jgi:hypothetical protein
MIAVVQQPCCDANKRLAYRPAVLLHRRWRKTSTKRRTTPMSEVLLASTDPTTLAVRSNARARPTSNSSGTCTTPSKTFPTRWTDRALSNTPRTSYDCFEIFAGSSVYNDGDGGYENVSLSPNHSCYEHDTDCFKDCLLWSLPRCQRRL